MFLAGADGTTPELRAPSIKGALRFWWRAMNGDLFVKKNKHWDYTKLSEQEGKIFGDTKIRSAIILRILNESVKGKTQISLTPHHRSNYCHKDKPNCYFKNNRCSKSFLKEGRFVNFDLAVCFDDKILDQQEVEKLVKVTFLLGGLGKRSRRGFGSVRITQVDGKKECSSLPEENFTDTLILKRNQDFYPDYPFIKDIKMGNQPYHNYETLLIKIGENSHLNKHDSLGYAYPKRRLASPIYTSIIKADDKFYPIITTLNSTFGETSNQDKYKQAILSS